MRKWLAVVVITGIMGALFATSAFAQDTVETKFTAVGAYTIAGSIKCQDGEPPLCEATITGLDSLKNQTAQGKKAAVIVGYTEANCAAGKQAALLFDPQVPQSEGAAMVEGVKKGGALITAQNIPAGNAQAAVYAGGLASLKSWAVIDFIALQGSFQGDVAACGNVGGAAPTTGGGTTPVATATATTGGTPKTGTGFPQDGTWAWVIVAGVLAVTGMGLVGAGVRSRR